MVPRGCHFILLALLLMLSSVTDAQNMSTNGRFPSRHFSVDDFGSAAQVWTGMYGTDNLVYFGNNTDILCYNGIDWKRIDTDTRKTSKKVQKYVKDTRVSSMFVASNNVMYVGRDDNFGYIAYSDSGVPRYFPMWAKATGTSEAFGSVWNMYELNNQEIIFVGENAVFTAKDKVVSKMALPASFSGFITRTSTRFGNGLLLVFQGENAAGERIYKYLYIDITTGKSKELKLPKHIQLRNIRGSFESNGKWYVLDISGAFYSAVSNNNKLVWNTEKEKVLSDLTGFDPNFVYRHGNRLYLGTETHGVIISDLEGTIVRRLDLYDELEDLNVYKLFHDNEENLWLCLDNGIQLFETSSPVTYFKKNEGITSLAEAMDFGSGKLLLGLHTDLFEPELSETHTKFVSKKVMNQLVFDVETFNTSQGQKTLVIGYNGLYEYFPASNTNKGIASAYGYMLEQDSENNDIIYLSLERGIGQLKLLPSGKWEYTELVAASQISGNTFKLSSLNGKIYFGIFDEGIGIYNTKTKKLKILKDKKVLARGEKKTFYVERFNGKIYAGCDNKLFTISSNDSKLVPFPDSDEFFGIKGNTIHRIVNLNDEQLWVVLYRNSGVKLEIDAGWLERHGKRWIWTKWPLQGLRNAGMISTIQQGPDNEVWLGASNGLFVLNFDAIRKLRGELKVCIDRFEVNGKTVRYNVLKANKIESLKYAQNSFKLVFHATSFRGLGNMEYRYMLEGFNDEWSDWSNLNFANFQKVSEGTYKVKIQARNPYGITSEVLVYEVTVLPPWYRTIWAYMLYVITLILLILFVTQLSTQRIKRQNLRLEAIVRERTSEIAEQNHQLEQQKEEITAKTTDILDSIQYAKRIQTTILPTNTRLNELFEEHFVFYRPKDIVSGDFYWARETQGKTIFSAVDCTGHGVPGSLVSIVGNNGLLRAVNEFKLTEPHEILDKLREIVINAFISEGQSEVKDGMDISLCSLDYKTGTLKYAGANNECVIIRGGEIIELKPDKQPIGSFIDAKPFTQKEFQLEDGDCIYLYTDGYVDQFGGDKLKKFKSRPFKTMLLELSHLPMSEQFVNVQLAFDNWKSDLDQIDDVCVFGVRYKKR